MKDRPPKFQWNPFTIQGEAPASYRGMPPLAIAPLAGLIAGWMTVGGAVATVATTTVATIISYGVVYGGLMGAAMLASSTQNTKSPTSIRGGTLINGHSSGDALRIVYGSARTGGTWGFWKTTSVGITNLNQYLHVVIGWCEGECALDKDLEQPFFKGTGISDCISSGPYSGATYSKYQIVIDGVGTPDTFKWRVGTGVWTTGVAITGLWQNLNDGARIKFTSNPAIVGSHTLKDSWEMYGGDGLWAGDRLYYAMQGVIVDGVSIDWITPHFHSGSLTQTVDTDLQAIFPQHDNPYRGTCYHYIQLRGTLNTNIDVWQSIPEFKTRLKKIDILDTRGPSTGYSNNAALIWYDFLTNPRYGRGLATTNAITADINAAVNWCDPSKVTNGGSTYTCIGDHTSGASTQPGVGANWTTFWALTGTGGSAWVTSTYYRMGYQFNGVILDRKEANEHLKEIAMNFLGFSFESDGKTRLKVWDNDAAAATFTEFEKEVIIDPSAFNIEQPGIEDSPNVVTCHFTNPDKNWGWDTISYPDDTSLSVLPPSGNLVNLEIELIGTISKRQAKQIAKYHFNRLNLPNRFKVLCSPKLFAYEPGDMLTLTHEFPAWVGKKLRIDTYGIQQEGLVPVVFADEAASIYDLEVKIVDEDINISGYPIPPVPPYPTPPIPTPQTGDIQFLAHYDGPTPMQTDFTGNLVDTFGLAPSVNVGGVIFRPGRFGKGVQISETTMNLITNPSFEVDTSGWSFSGLSGTRISGGTVGSYCLRLYIASSGGGDYGMIHVPSLSPATVYSVGVDVKKIQCTGTGVIRIWWYNGGASISYSDIALDSGLHDWKRYSSAFTSPANTTHAYVSVVDAGATGIFELNIEAVQFEAKAYPTPYCDGSLGQGHSWNGTAHASSSVRTVADLRYSSAFVNQFKGAFLLFFTPAYGDQSAGAVDRILFDLRDGSNLNAPVLYHNHTTNYFWLLIGGANVIGGYFPLTSGTSYFIVVNYDYANTIFEVWVNAVLISDTPGAQTQPTLGATIQIGARYNQISLANGVIDDFCHVNRVVTASEIQNIFSSNAPISVISSILLDRLPPQPDPPQGMGNNAVKDQSTGIGKRQVLIYCTVGTDTGSPPVMTQFEGYIDPSNLELVATPWQVSGNFMVKDLDAGSTLYWRVRQKDQKDNPTSVSAWQTVSVGYPTGPSGPASAVVTTKGNSFLLLWSLVAGAQVRNYLIYVNTTNNSGTAKLIKTFGITAIHGEIDIGAVSYDTSITLDYDTPYYFWILAEDIHGQDSSLVAFTGNPIVINKGEWLLHFTCPWKKKNFIIPSLYKQTGAGTTTYTVPANKVALLMGYKFTIGNSSISRLKINGNVIEAIVSGSWEVTPQTTNGIYLGAGTTVTAEVVLGITGTSQFRVQQFDADPNITCLIADLHSTYTVTTGKTLTITFLRDYSGSSNYLQIYEDGSWVNIYDLNVESWNISKGALQFPSGTQIQSSVGSVYLYGYEIKTS